MEEVKIKEICTDEKEDRRWCVYIHTNKHNGKVYVGITSKEPHRRWGINGSQYREKGQRVFYRAIQKYGWDNFKHEIVAKGLTKEEAETIEVDLIALYKSNCRRYKNPTFGYNQTDGGSGTIGYCYTESQRKRMSASAKARCTDEWRQRISKLMTGRKMSKAFSEKLRKRMSKAVVQLDLHGEYITQYDSARGAGLVTGIDESSIRKCCKGELKNAGGFLWADLSKWCNDPEYISAIKVKQNGRPVVQLDLKGNLIKQYISAKEASKETGVLTGKITICCNHQRKSVNGYMWVFLDEYMDGFRPNFIVPHKRQVIQLSVDGDFIAEYNTIAEASRMLGINQSAIVKCCKGKNKLASGFRWIYKEDYKK